MNEMRRLMETVKPLFENTTHGASNKLTFGKNKRKLNIPELIKRGAIFITHPHGPGG